MSNLSRALILGLGFILFDAPIANAQERSFRANLLFNANGVQIEGQESIYWSNDGGKVWGTGGLSLGSGINRSFNDHWHVAFELRYIRKGSIYEYVDDFGMMEYEVLKLNYFELPLVLGYTFRPHGKYRMLETGVAISRMFASQVALDDLAQRKESPDVENFKDWDLSWVGTLKFPLNRRKGDNLHFGLRVEHSILSIHEVYRLYNFVYGLELVFLI